MAPSAGAISATAGRAISASAAARQGDEALLAPRLEERNQGQDDSRRYTRHEIEPQRTSRLVKARPDQRLDQQRGGRDAHAGHDSDRGRELSCPAQALRRRAKGACACHRRKLLHREGCGHQQEWLDPPRHCANEPCLFRACDGSQQGQVQSLRDPPQLGDAEAARTLPRIESERPKLGRNVAAGDHDGKPGRHDPAQHEAERGPVEFGAARREKCEEHGKEVPDEGRHSLPRASGVPSRPQRLPRRWAPRPLETTRTRLTRSGASNRTEPARST